MSTPGPTNTETDFWLRFTSSSAADPSDPTLVTVSVEIGNAGSQPATQPVNFVLISPFYTIFDNPSSVSYFSRYIVQNANPAIPEMVEFSIPASDLASQGSAQLDVSLDVLPNGPRIFDMIYGCIETTADTEITLLNNEALGTMGVPIAALPAQPSGTNAVNYYFVYPPPRLAADEAGAFQLSVGNAGTSAPTSNATFTFVSPYRMKVNRPLASTTLGATFLHDETDPGIPDIMTFPVSQLLLNPDPNLLTAVSDLGLLNIPVTNSGGAHSCRSGKGFLAANGNDFDTQPGISMARMPIIEPV
jgi:hypothetical protein